MIGISTGFVCHGQYWLVYQSVLSAVDNNGWYIFQFCMSWTILVGLSPSFVCHGQYWLVYLPVLSVVDNIGWYITRFCLSWAILGGILHGCVCRGQYWLVYHPVLSSVDSYGWYILVGILTAFVCLSWTVMVGLSSRFVCRGQYLPSVVCHEQLWLEYITVLSVADNIDWFITRFSLSWTILGGIFNRCVLLGQYWLENQPFFFFHGQ